MMRQSLTEMAASSVEVCISLICIVLEAERNTSRRPAAFEQARDSSVGKVMIAKINKKTCYKTHSDSCQPENFGTSGGLPHS